MKKYDKYHPREYSPRVVGKSTLRYHTNKLIKWLKTNKKAGIQSTIISVTLDGFAGIEENFREFVRESGCSFKFVIYHSNLGPKHRFHKLLEISTTIQGEGSLGMTTWTLLPPFPRTSKA
jgi:hypothetical protein